MAKNPSKASVEREAGAPVARDAIDPDLIKLRRTRAKVGIITAAGILILCVYFLFRLGPDRRFGGSSDKPTAVAVADVLAGRVDSDEFVQLEAEPLLSNAIRTVKAKGDVGLRLVPVRGTNEQLWLALPGDAWDQPVTDNRYEGRLRKLSDLPFAVAARTYAAQTPRPIFAASAAVRAAMTSGKVKAVTGDEILLTDSDPIAFDLVEPNKATIIASFNERLPSAQVWLTAFSRAGVPAKLSTQKPVDDALGQARFDVEAMSPTDTTMKLEAAELWAARVEPVKRHFSTTWGVLKRSPPAGLVAGGEPIPDAQIDLVGVYVAREISDDAYALITTEVPQDYWHVMPITIVLVGIGLLFAWALVRAVRRDLLPTRA